MSRNTLISRHSVKGGQRCATGDHASPCPFCPTIAPARRCLSQQLSESDLFSSRSRSFSWLGAFSLLFGGKLLGTLLNADEHPPLHHERARLSSDRRQAIRRRPRAIDGRGPPCVRRLGHRIERGRHVSRFCPTGSRRGNSRSAAQPLALAC